MDSNGHFQSTLSETVKSFLSLLSMFLISSSIIVSCHHQHHRFNSRCILKPPLIAFTQFTEGVPNTRVFNLEAAVLYMRAESTLLQKS